MGATGAAGAGVAAGGVAAGGAEVVCIRQD